MKRSSREGDIIVSVSSSSSEFRVSTAEFLPPSFGDWRGGRKTLNMSRVAPISFRYTAQEVRRKNGANSNVRKVYGLGAGGTRWAGGHAVRGGPLQLRLCIEIIPAL